MRTVGRPEFGVCAAADVHYLSTGGARAAAMLAAEFGIPVIGVAKSRFRTATHAVPVPRGSSLRPLFVTAAAIPRADAADPVRRMADRYRLPDAPRRADPSRGQARPLPP
jgi:deoxyribonuclease V